MRSWRITSGSCSTDIGGVGTGTDLVAVGSLDNDVLDGGLEGFPSLNVGVGGGGLSWAIEPIQKQPYGSFSFVLYIGIGQGLVVG
jgi:hypothetical protein